MSRNIEKVYSSRGRLKAAIEEIDQELIRRVGGADGYFVGSHHVMWFRPELVLELLKDRQARARAARLAWIAELARVAALPLTFGPLNYPGPVPTRARPEQAKRAARVQARVEVYAAELVYLVAVEKYRHAEALYQGRPVRA